MPYPEGNLAAARLLQQGDLETRDHGGRTARRHYLPRPAAYIRQFAPPKASRSQKFPAGSAISRSRPLSTSMVTWSPRPPAAPVTRSIAPSAARRHMCPKCARPDPRVILRRRSRPYEGGEPACRPGSVRPLARGGGHPSGTAVADSLVRSTREHRAGRPRSLAQGAAGSPLDLAPGGVYRAAAVTCGAGGLLHHRFTLTPADAGAVCFLWHCPAGHPGSALPTTLPYGARTFLTRLAPGATARPTHPCSGYARCHRPRVANRTGAGERG